MPSNPVMLTFIRLVMNPRTTSTASKDRARSALRRTLGCTRSSSGRMHCRARSPARTGTSRIPVEQSVRAAPRLSQVFEAQDARTRPSTTTSTRPSSCRTESSELSPKVLGTHATTRRSSWPVRRQLPRERRTPAAAGYTRRDRAFRARSGTACPAKTGAGWKE